MMTLRKVTFIEKSLDWQMNIFKYSDLNTH